MFRTLCLLVSLLTSTAALGATLKAHVQRGASSESVILITIDALRASNLSAYGYSRPTTPAMDALAREGILFERYYANSNWTRPSTASLMTGLLPSSMRWRPMVPCLMAPIGLSLSWPKSRDIGPGRLLEMAMRVEPSAFRVDSIGFKTRAIIGKGLPNASEVFALGEQFLEESKQSSDGKPFFLWLFTVDQHDPYHAPGAYETMFVRNPKVKLVRSPHWEKRKYSKAQIERMVDTYDGALRYTDDQIARLITRLKTLGLYDSTTIIVTSDHGEGFGEHGYFMRTTSLRNSSTFRSL